MRSFAAVSFLAFLAVSPHALAGQLSRMNSSSMKPFLEKDEVFEMDTAGTMPARGDVVAYEDKFYFISRVVGLAGDTVEIRDGKLLVNGAAADYKAVPSTKSYKAIKVPAGTFFVIGDNRDHANDSRFKGPIPLTLLHGKVTRVLRPAPEYMTAASPPKCLGLEKGASTRDLSLMFKFLEHSAMARPIVARVKEKLAKGELKLVKLDAASLEAVKRDFPSVASLVERAEAFYLAPKHMIFIKDNSTLGVLGLVFIHEADHALDESMRKIELAINELRDKIGAFLKLKLTKQQLESVVELKKRNPKTDGGALIEGYLSEQARDEYRKLLEELARNVPKNIRELRFASERHAYDVQHRVVEELIKTHACLEPLLVWHEINARYTHHVPSDAEIRRLYGI